MEPNDFQALEDIIIQSYQARDVGIWIGFLRNEKVDPKRVEATISWLNSQSAESWMSMLGRISRKSSPSLSSFSLELVPPVCDEQFKNHQIFCHHVESYLTLRYAIKHADIGLLRHALRHVTIISSRFCENPQVRAGATSHHACC